MIDTMMYHDPMERKRQEYIKELIVTEQAYIEDMRLVHEVFFSFLNSLCLYLFRVSVRYFFFSSKVSLC